MSQFDVHRNPGRRSTILYVVVLQSQRFEGTSTRFVAGLTKPSPPPPWYDLDVSPSFVVEGIEVMLDVMNMGTLPAARLGPVVATLDDEHSRTKIQRALDEFLSHA